MGRTDWSTAELRLLDDLCEGDEPVAYALHLIPDRDRARAWLARLLVESMLEVLIDGTKLAREQAIGLLWTDLAWTYHDGNPILHVTDAGHAAFRTADPRLLRMVASQHA